MTKSLLAFVFCAACVAQDGLVYSRILPVLGNQYDTAVTAMAADGAGNIYLTGWTSEPSVPVTPGVVQPTFNGGECTNGSSGGGTPTPPQEFPCPVPFVIKLDAQSKVVFATYLAGYQPTSIGVDAAGNIYVAGITAGIETPPCRTIPLPTAPAGWSPPPPTTGVPTGSPVAFDASSLT